MTHRKSNVAPDIPPVIKACFYFDVFIHHSSHLTFLQSVLGALVVINLKGMLMQFREIPYLWRRDKPDCVSSNCVHYCIYSGFLSGPLCFLHNTNPSWVTVCSMLSTAGLGGDLSCCLRAWTWSRPGGRFGIRAANGRLQDTIVRWDNDLKCVSSIQTEFYDSIKLGH